MIFNIEIGVVTQLHPSKPPIVQPVDGAETLQELECVDPLAAKSVVRDIIEEKLDRSFRIRAITVELSPEEGDRPVIRVRLSRRYPQAPSNKSWVWKRPPDGRR